MRRRLAGSRGLNAASDGAVGDDAEAAFRAGGSVICLFMFCYSCVQRGEVRSLPMPSPAQRGGSAGAVTPRCALRLRCRVGTRASSTSTPAPQPQAAPCSGGRVPARPPSPSEVGAVPGSPVPRGGGEWLPRVTAAPAADGLCPSPGGAATSPARGLGTRPSWGARSHQPPGPPLQPASQGRRLPGLLPASETHSSLCHRSHQ